MRGFVAAALCCAVVIVAVAVAVRAENDEAAIACEFKKIDTPAGCNCSDPCNGLTCAPLFYCEEGHIVAINTFGSYYQDVLPEDIGNLTRLKRIDLLYSNIAKIPQSLSTLEELYYLDVLGNALTNWSELTTFPSLSLITASNNPFGDSFSNLKTFGKLSNTLAQLEIKQSNITKIPVCIKELTALIGIDLTGNSLVTVPSDLFLLPSLTGLTINGNLLTSLPDGLERSHVRNLDVGTNRLTAFPDSFFLMKDLAILSINGNWLSKSIDIASFKKLFYLQMSYTNVSELCDSILDSRLISLVANGNNLPATTDFSRMKSLQQLSISGNGMESVPPLPTSLAVLIIDNNNITTIPESFKSLPNLQYLSAESNAITSLPDVFNNTKFLSYVSLRMNYLTSLPDSLLSLYVPFLTIDYNCLDCAEIHRKANGSIWDAKCNPDVQNHCFKKSRTALVTATTIGSFCILMSLIVTIALWKLRKAKRELNLLKRSSSLNVPLISGHEGLVEIAGDDDEHGVRVEPRELTFGTAATEVPLDVDLEDHITVTGLGLQRPFFGTSGGLNRSRKMRSSGAAFQVEIPDLQTSKCTVSVTCPADRVRAGEAVTITVRLRMLCTTMLDLPLYVIANGGFAKVRVAVASQLSTRIDADEVVCGEVLGAGSFGTVFRGEWRGNTELAVKAYNASTLQDIGLQQDIEREVEMCFKLRHPNVVSFYGRTVQSERLYIVMELAEHGSLGSLLSKGAVDLRFKVRVALDVARGMNYLHKNHIIHRDLKSDNVLLASLDAGGSVVAKLSDFNTSRFWGSDAMRTKTKGVGTPIFMAPEILDGKHYSWMADVYSFGVMLWHMWTQKEPYAEITSSLQLFKFVLEGNRLEMPEDLPDALKQITSNSWKHVPEERPSFQDLAQSLGDFFSHMQ